MFCRQPIFTKKCILSESIWRNSDPWRPRSCYLFIARKLMMAPNYQRWNDFNWGDFIEREHLIKTFDNRHLPVLRGQTKIPSKYITDPPMWSQVTPTSSTKKKDRPTSSFPVANVSVKRTLMWDFENEKWVPNEMGSQVTSSSKRKSTTVANKKKKKKKTNTNES